VKGATKTLNAALGRTVEEAVRELASCTLSVLFTSTRWLVPIRQAANGAIGSPARARKGARSRRGGDSEPRRAAQAPDAVPRIEVEGKAEPPKQPGWRHLSSFGWQPNRTPPDQHLILSDSPCHEAREGEAITRWELPAHGSDA
jgi:hypothetical protein